MIGGCAFEIDDYDYTLVKEMLSETPDLGPLVDKCLKDDVIDKSEYYDIKQEYKQLRTRSVKEQIKERLQR